MESPAAHRSFMVMFSKTSGQLLREHMRIPRHLDLHPHTRHKAMFMRQDCCARTPQAHLDLSPYAKNMFRRKNCCALSPRAHLDLFPCAKRHVPAKKLLHSHAASTLGCLSVRKETCSCDNSVEFARCEHAWTSLRAQKDMFHRKDCCDLALHPQNR